MPDRESQRADRERQDLDRERQKADRERQPLDRERQKADGERQSAAARERRTPDRERRRNDAVDSTDALWPPFGPQSSADRGARAHRMMHEHDRRRDQRGRGRAAQAQSLSRAEIVDAAIAIADAEGADAVSMRRIAQVLRAGTMSLYWHVANKEHLLDLMIDALMAEVGIPEPSGDWRADLQAFARENRAMLLRHLWVMDFVGGRPPLGPNTLLGTDRLLAVMGGVGLDPATAMNVLGTVLTYVMGAALREMREARQQRDQEQSGIESADWEPALAAWRDRLAADGRLTHVVQFLGEGIDPDAEETRDERFEFGLDCVLDGIAAKITRLPGRAPA